MYVAPESDPSWPGDGRFQVDRGRLHHADATMMSGCSQLRRRHGLLASPLGGTGFVEATIHAKG